MKCLKYWIIFFGFVLSSCRSAPESGLLSEPTLAGVPPVRSAAPATRVSNMAVEELGAALNSGNAERIKNASTEVLLSNSRDVVALNALATYYYGKNQWAASELLLKKALSYNSKAPVLHNNLGLVMLAKNEKTEALQTFHRAMEADPSYYPASANAAAIYAQEKDYHKVIFSLENAVKNNEADAGALNNYAVALGATGKYQDASAIYEKLLQKEPSHPGFLLNYAILSIEKMGKYQQGLDLLNRLKFVGSANESRQVINDLEVKAKAGLK